MDGQNWKMEQNKLIDEVFEPRLTIKEAGKYLGIPVVNMYYLINTKKIPFFVSFGIRFIKLIDVVKYRSQNNL